MLPNRGTTDEALQRANRAVVLAGSGHSLALWVL